MHQQLKGYRVEEKIYQGVREREMLNITGLMCNDPVLSSWSGTRTYGGRRTA